MQLNEFEIGKPFFCGGELWICTDIGTRVITAIGAKTKWRNGPPYAVAEYVFDENDQSGCSLKPDSFAE